MMRLQFLSILVLFSYSTDGQRHKSDLRQGENRPGDRQETTFDVSQWYRGPKDSPRGQATRDLQQQQPSRPQSINAGDGPNSYGPMVQSPNYHPQSGQRSRSIDPWRASFDQSPFYNGDRQNYKPLAPPPDDTYNEEFFRLRGVSVNVPKVQKIAPGVMGQILYTADSIESLEEKMNREPQRPYEEAQRPYEHERLIGSSTERQLLQLLGHVSSQNQIFEFSKNKGREQKPAEPLPYDDNEEMQSEHDSTKKKVRDSKKKHAVVTEDDEIDDETTARGQAPIANSNSEESKLVVKIHNETDVAENDVSEEEEEYFQDDDDDYFFSEETSSKSPTFLAATGIPARWTQLPLLPPATPPAGKRGSFYNGNQKHDPDHHNTHHKADHGLSAASVFARIKPHLKGDALPIKPLPPKPVKPRPTHKPHVEESDEEYDYSEEYGQKSDEYHKHDERDHKHDEPDGHRQGEESGHEYTKGEMKSSTTKQMPTTTKRIPQKVETNSTPKPEIESEEAEDEKNVDNMSAENDEEVKGERGVDMIADKDEISGEDNMSGESHEKVKVEMAKDKKVDKEENKKVTNSGDDKLPLTITLKNVPIRKETAGKDESGEDNMSGESEENVKVGKVNDKKVDREENRKVAKDDEDELPLMKNFKNVVIKKETTGPTEGSGTPPKDDVIQSKTFRKSSREGKIVEPIDDAIQVDDLTNQASIHTQSEVNQIHNGPVITPANGLKDVEDPPKDEGKTTEKSFERPETTVTPEKLTTVKVLRMDIKPGDIKSLLKTSEGLSLSEVLQKHGLSLPEFLRNGLKGLPVNENKTEPLSNDRKIEPPSNDEKLETTSNEKKVESPTNDKKLDMKSKEEAEREVEGSASTEKKAEISRPKPAFDMSMLKPISIGEMLKNKATLRKPNNMFAAIYDRMTTTEQPSEETTITERTTRGHSRWSTKSTAVNGTETTITEQPGMTTPTAVETNRTTTKKTHKAYVPPAQIGEYGVFEGARQNTYGNQRPIHRTRMDEKMNKVNKTKRVYEDFEEVSAEVELPFDSEIQTETTLIVIEDDEELDRTKFINIPVEIRGAIIASSAIGGFALIVFLVIFIILWQRNRKVRAGTLASEFIRRALENSGSGTADSETSSTSEAMFNPNMSYRKNGFWGTLGRSVWK